MRYLLTSADGKTVANTLIDSDKEHLDVSSESTITTNGRHRIGRIATATGTIFAIADEPDFLKSSQKFKNTARCIAASVNYINDIVADHKDANNKNTSRLIHNLTSLNAHNIQEIYSLIPQEEISGRMNGHVRFVRDKIRNHSTEAANVLLRIAKNNAAMKTEFSVFKKLFVAQPDLRPSFHMMHKVLMNVLYLFFPDFTDKGIELDVDRSDAVAYFDYESIHVALYHLIDNAAKYSKPDSKLHISIAISGQMLALSFKMRSTKVLTEEHNQIYDEGFSGSLPTKLGKAGDGIGMSLVKRVVESNRGTIAFRSLPGSCETVSGIDYEINEFIVQLPTSKPRKSFE